MFVVTGLAMLSACAESSDDGDRVAAADPGVATVESVESVDGTRESEWRPENLPGVGSVLGTQRATYEYVIPPGASDRLAAGEPLEIVPGRFEAKVGESVKIVNNDRRGHNVGPWYVGPNETLLQKFTSPGLYEGLCTVHPSGALILEVTEA